MAVDGGSIEDQYRQILGEMEAWFSYGTTMNLNATAGGEGSGRPPGEEWPLHLEWRMRWDRAFNKAKVLEDATEALERARKQHRPVVVPESQAQLEARIIGEGNGWSVRDVANHCRCTEKLVRRARLKAGVDAETGQGLAMVAERLPRNERAERARAMRAEGMTMRQIAMLLRVDPMTVHRDLAA